MSRPHVVILGAGAAGLAAARQLVRRGLARVTVLEQAETVGGLAGSFDLEGIRVDYGSHRLHPACPPEILADLRNVLGRDLLERPRNGRIRLRGRWLRFPLRPLDLAVKLPLSFSLGVTSDILARGLSRVGDRGAGDSFASVLERGLGKTICRDFYFPYARKIWGVEPAELSRALARLRVSDGSIGRLVRKVLGGLPGLKRSQGRSFFYPAGGFGRICESLADAAVRDGARVLLSAGLREVEVLSSGFEVRHSGDAESLAADFVWSTIPLIALLSCLRPVPPSEVLAAAQALEWRPLLLVYLVLDQTRFSDFDAHYLPEAEFPLSRLSEPKNYSGSYGPEGLTVLCAEIPCAVGSPEWEAGDRDLGDLVRDALNAAGLPIRSAAVRVATRRIPYAYPVYRQGYEGPLARVRGWLSSVAGLLVFGRQGLFAHDNIHHSLRLGYDAAACLGPGGRFDQGRWEGARAAFDALVVED